MFHFTFNAYEAVGLVATVLLVISLCFNTKTFKGTLCMRVLNLLCSAVWIVYGVLLGLLATFVSNILCVLINLYYLILAVKNRDSFGK